MPKLIDITNQRFGRLKVIEYVGNSKWLCQCDCGKQKVISGRGMREGLVISCGCYHKEDIKSSQTTHNSSKTRIYHIWQNVKRRCYNPNYIYFKYYGGKGIIMCNEWLNDFPAFKEWSLKNGYSDVLTLDRIDSNGNYEPSNCRWVSRKDQQNNTSRCHKFTIDGQTKTIAEWCSIYNVPHERIRRRVVNEGWDILDALTTPPLKRNKKPR